MGAGVLAERICDWWASDAVAVSPAPKAQEQAEHKLSAAGVFKGAEGLRGLLDAQDFWDKQPYGTRLYFGEMANEYLHRDVLRAAVALLDQRQEQAPQPAPGAEEWQPIETAPRNRSLLLCVAGTPVPIYCGRYRTGNLGEPQPSQAAWRCDSSGRFANPTHWQPLPAPPVAAHSGKGE